MSGTQSGGAPGSRPVVILGERHITSTRPAASSRLQRGGNLVMEPVHPDLIPAPAVEAAEFVRFCYRRRRSGWPELYDEMCAVAGRGLFRGWGPDELAQVGIGLSLFQLPALAALSMEVIAQEAAESHSGSTRERRPAPAVVTESLGAIGTAVMSAAGVPEGIAHQEGRSDRAGARQAESVGEQPEGSRLILPGGAPALA